MTDSKNIDVLWDDNPVDITEEANFIWSIANKLRGAYLPDKYGDVIIPMTIVRRFECVLSSTKETVVEMFKEDPTLPPQVFERASGYQFYNTSEFTLKELLNDPDHIETNFISYIDSFSPNVQQLLNSVDSLNMSSHIKKMNKEGCLYTVVKAFSELDLSPSAFDSIKMGYIFENLIGRFFQNVDAGQFYTGRDIIKLCVSLLISEGADDLGGKGKIITVCDQACGTGGMLSTAYNYLKYIFPGSDVRLFGQELNGVSHAVGLAEMLIKGQSATNFRHVDTFKEDCFPDIKMRFLLENPPFGTPWGGKDAKDGQEDAVKEEFKRGKCGRWGAGLPGTSDAQLIFIQSALAKLDDQYGRAAIIENGSPLFASGNAGTASGESQIRRYLLENDLIEAIVQMPTDLFYNTSISTYIWILSKNKRPERKGKIQLIDASNICHKLRKSLGNKKNEFSPEDRAKITKLYANFEENELVKIFDNTEFLYKEYAVMQPLQRSYSITEESIENMLQKGALNSLWDEAKVADFEEQGTTIAAKDKKKYDELLASKPLYDSILEKLNAAKSDEKWLSPTLFKPFLKKVLSPIDLDKKIFEKVMDGLSVMDKEAEIQKDKKGNIIYDKETKDTEIVRFNEDIEDYMKREVLPHVPDAKWFWEENLSAKKPVIKVGAEIPFTRYFYKYQQPTPSDELAAKFIELEKSVSSRITSLFGGK
jgi:type I restriction enzyme M protein